MFSRARSERVAGGGRRLTPKRDLGERAGLVGSSPHSFRMDRGYARRKLRQDECVD